MTGVARPPTRKRRFVTETPVIESAGGAGAVTSVVND
jgi:hypothetical protein